MSSASPLGPEGGATDTVLRRYLFKLLANLASLFSSVAIEALASRGLGAQGYGNFQFLNNFFQRAVAFADFGTSTAFYTKLAQRPADGALVRFYWGYALLVAVALAVFILGVLGLGATAAVWPGQEIIYICWGAALAFLVWAATTAGRMTDAYGLTVPAEKVRLLQRLAALALIVALYAAGALQYSSYLAFHIAMALLLLAGSGWILAGSGKSLLGTSLAQAGDARGYMREFFHYSHPLAVSGLAGFVGAIADLWLLQRYGGSAEQAYFGLALRISGVCLIFVTAMTPLLMREFSIAFDQGDRKHMAVLFSRHTPLLYSITASLSCFIAVNGGRVTVAVGGSEFAQAAAAMAIMSFYPVLQVVGQLTGSICYATGNTRLYRNVGVAIALAGLPLACFLLLPADAYGLGLGASGLALKTVGLALVSTNILLFFNARLLQISLLRLLTHQLACVGAFALLAWAVSRALESLMPGAGPFALLAASAILYGASLLISVVACPPLWGLQRSDLGAVAEALRARRAR